MQNLAPRVHPASKGQLGLSVFQSVIICDDHLAIRAGLSRILEERNITVVGVCNTVAALLELVSQHPGAVVITDLAVDEMPFPMLVTKLREQSADCRVIVYSMREAPATIGLCYEAGAIAFVPKHADEEDIIKAVECASRDERYLPAFVASELANFHIDRNKPTNILSAREMEIFLGYAKDGSIEELSKKLFLSDKTVQNLLSQVAKKLDAPRSMFYQIAQRNGLLELP